MRKAQYTVTRKDVQEHTAALLQQTAGLKPIKGKCTLSGKIKGVGSLLQGPTARPTAGRPA